MTKAGVILSGCGFLDGAEIHESVFTLLHLDRAGAEIVCMAPDAPQMHVVNHASGKPVAGARNVLEESARIARGKIRDIAKVRAADLDALLMPGGYGAAKNLSDFATKGAECKVHPEVARLVREMVAAGKPLGAICISPAVVAAIFRGTDVHPTLTIGEDAGTAGTIESMGSRHRTCPVTGFVLDEGKRIATTPAYMYDARPSEVCEGIGKLVETVLRLARQKAGAR
jgi:enhancing lycopene biosynthesis protein 2